MYSTFNIGEIEIGKEPLVIPEMGINHEGSLDVAKLIVDAAARAGAKIIKYQTHIVEDEMSPSAKKVIPGNADVSIYEIMERCALSEEEEIELDNDKLISENDNYPHLLLNMQEHFHLLPQIHHI